MRVVGLAAASPAGLMAPEGRSRQVKARSAARCQMSTPTSTGFAATMAKENGTRAR